MAEITGVEGRRVYIKTQFGESVVQSLKNLGAKWDGERKEWWVGTAKKPQVEALLQAPAASAPATPATEDLEGIEVIGKARYKGREYYVRWVGECRNGEYKARLVSLDGKIDFWANCGRNGEGGNGSGDIAVIFKRYETRTEGRGRWQRDVKQTLGGIRRFIEKRKRDVQQTGDSPLNHRRTGCSCGSLEDYPQDTDCESCRFENFDQ